MSAARIRVDEQPAAVLRQTETGYQLEYLSGYAGPAISLTLPVHGQSYDFPAFPPFFDGLLPEGPQLEALLRQAKLDRNDYFGQLLTVGKDLVGAITVEPLDE